MSTEDKTIYELELHESIVIETKVSAASTFVVRVTKVPGGWIYFYSATSQNTKTISTSFVPFNSEYSNDYDEKGRKLGNREK